MRKTFFTLICVAGLGACTIQETYQGGVLTGRSVGFGLSSVPVCNGTPQTIKTTTIGIHVAPDRAVLGYFASDLICIPHECRAVFLVENTAEVERIRAMTGGLETICVYPN